MAYEEKLKDPRWHQRRLQVLIRDKYKCQKCSHKSKSNEVHHVVYVYGWEPWDYPDEYLMTLCRDCHEEETQDNKEIKEMIENMKLSGLFCSEIKAKMKLKF